MLQELLRKLDMWFVLGLAAQMAYAARFMVQWLASEKAGRSVIPNSFWYLSIVGGIGLLAYSIVRRDPLFILAQSLNSLVYVRNVMLIRRVGRTAQAGPAEPAASEPAPPPTSSPRDQMPC